MMVDTGIIHYVTSLKELLKQESIIGFWRKCITSSIHYVTYKIERSKHGKDSDNYGFQR